MVGCPALCQPSLRARLATAAFSGKAAAARVPSAPLPLSCVVARAGKGFDTKSDSKPPAPPADSAPAAASTSTADALDAVEALEQKIRNRRAKQRSQEAKVKVNAPVVDAVSNKDGTAPPEAQFETFLVGFLLYFFLFVLVEGLVISAAGFLPEDWDAFITDVLYPNYSTTVLGFLGCSSLYGLWKTGKLPGQPGGGSSS